MFHFVYYFVTVVLLSSSMSRDSGDSAKLGVHKMLSLQPVKFPWLR